MNKTAFTPQSGTDRLRTLYAIMAGVPAKRVDMKNWRNSLRVSNEEMLAQGCGTAACAVGWACAYPEFNKQGLFWNDNLWIPVYQGDGGWRAVERFFDLSMDEAKNLFQQLDSGIKAKRGVLKRIRFHLLRKGAITPERSQKLAVYEWSLKA